MKINNQLEEKQRILPQTQQQYEDPFSTIWENVFFSDGQTFLQKPTNSYQRVIDHLWTVLIEDESESGKIDDVFEVWMEQALREEEIGDTPLSMMMEQAKNVCIWKKVTPTKGLVHLASKEFRFCAMYRRG